MAGEAAARIGLARNQPDEKASYGGKEKLPPVFLQLAGLPAPVRQYNWLLSRC